MTQPVGNFVVLQGPRQWEAAWPRASRDFSEGRLFHRKMFLCWNLKHSMGMCWFGHHLFWKPGRHEGWLAGQPTRVGGSQPAQPEAPRAYRSNNACEPSPINYFYQNVRHTFIKIFKRCLGFKRLKNGNINPLSSGIHIRAKRLQFSKPSAKKKKGQGMNSLSQLQYFTTMPKTLTGLFVREAWLIDLKNPNN